MGEIKGVIERKKRYVECVCSLHLSERENRWPVPLDGERDGGGGGDTGEWHLQ